MEVSQLIELMNAVSEAGLTDFCYEENGVSVKIKKHPEKKIVASAPVEMIAPAAIAAPAQILGSSFCGRNCRCNRMRLPEIP